MKKLNLVLILEGILLAAVIVLFVLFFNGKCTSLQSAAGANTETADSLAPANGQIAYVNVDSLMQNYLMSKTLGDELTEKTKKLDAELGNKQKKHQNNVDDFRNKAEKGLETRAKLADMEQQLMADQQGLMQLSENYRMQIMEEQSVMQRKILQAIMDYLAEYNKEKGYQYIMGNSFGGQLLFADKTLDITASVLAGINAKYTAEHPAKK